MNNFDHLQLLGHRCRDSPVVRHYTSKIFHDVTDRETVILSMQVANSDGWDYINEIETWKVVEMRDIMGRK